MINLINSKNKGQSSSPWVPTELGTSVLRAWYDISTVDGDFVTTDGGTGIIGLTDRSGNGYSGGTLHFASWKPQLNVGAEGFTRALSAAGSNYRLDFPTWGISGIDQHTVLFAFHAGVSLYTDAGYVRIGDKPPAESNAFNFAAHIPAIVNRSGGYIFNDTLDPLPVDEGRNIYCVRVAAPTPLSSIRFNINGEDYIEPNVGSMPNPLSAGGGIGTPTSAAFLAEALIIKGLLSDSDRQKCEGYLAHKHDITDKLPVTHPYKTNPPTL